MIEQTYFLDMIPGESAAPVVHVSQFDVNSRTLTFNLMKGGVAYEPDVGMTVTLDGTKPDNTAFSYPMTVDGSSVSIALQPQMTVLSGHVRCEVTVSSASGQIGSANFILAVEESAIDTGAISDTDIPIFEDLKNQAQQAAAEATAAAQTVSAILPENVGTVGQVLTRTGTGAAWDDVDGLPAGGTVGQVLTKQSSTDGDADWETPASGGTWGSITGTLSDQTDLQNALDAKSNIGNIATIESSPASANHAVGEFIVYNGQMYSVIDGITAGQALTPSNISATSAGDELSSLKAGINNRFRTVTSGSLYDIKASGIYYLSSAVTNKPTANGGFYYCSFYGNTIYGGIFVPAYDGTATRPYLIFTNNGTTWATYPITPKQFETTTVTATTTSSGAVEIPTADVSKTLVNAVLTSQAGFVFRRDTTYFTVTDNALNPLANTQVTIQATWMY